MTLARTAAVICAVASSAGLIAAQSDDGQFSGRAVFFNDPVAVGWIPRAPLLEIAALDPEQGMIFS